MRDVIMISGCTWKDFNISERLARSFALLGARVLYCAGPVSRLKQNQGGLTELEPEIWGFTPKIWAHRLNRWPVVSTMQAKMIADQISQSRRISTCEIRLSSIPIWPALWEFVKN